MGNERYMSSIALETLSNTELATLIRKAEKELARRQEKAKRDLQKQFARLASEAGVDLSDVLGTASVGVKTRGRKAGTGAPKAAPKEKLPAKFKNPDDPSQTWSGHGRRPAWFVAHIDGGGDIKALAIRARRVKAE